MAGTIGTEQSGSIHYNERSILKRGVRTMATQFADVLGGIRRLDAPLVKHGHRFIRCRKALVASRSRWRALLSELLLPYIVMGAGGDL